MYLIFSINMKRNGKEKKLLLWEELIQFKSVCVSALESRQENGTLYKHIFCTSVAQNENCRVHYTLHSKYIQNDTCPADIRRYNTHLYFLYALHIPWCVQITEWQDGWLVNNFLSFSSLLFLILPSSTYLL
jgi:hypothetical protein